MNLMYTHIFWDFDGTLFDTYPMMARALQETLREELKIEESFDEIYAFMKITIREALAHYRAKYDLSDELIRRFEERREQLEREAGPFEGACELLEELRCRGAVHYLYTHRDLNAREMLRKYDLADSFKLMITAEDGFPYKPAPDALLEVCGRWDIPKSAALMVGDREIDILAGKNAGMDSCLIGAAGKSEATYVVPDIAGLSSLLLASDKMRGKQVQRR